MLLDKAWAKLQGSYARTEGGFTADAAAHLLGCPNQSLRHEDYKENSSDLWKELVHADSHKYTILCESNGDNEVMAGVIGGHAYSVIGVRTITHQGQEVRLLQIRNPWGCGEWTGAWSDKDPNWTEDLKQEVGFTDADDGLFFMAFDCYLRNFHQTMISVEVDFLKYRH